MAFLSSAHLCLGAEVKPCKGDLPIVNPLTGVELNCGNRPFRQDCPSGSYCHQTAAFAKCCRKGDKCLLLIILYALHTSFILMVYIIKLYVLVFYSIINQWQLMKTKLCHIQVAGCPTNS